MRKIIRLVLLLSVLVSVESTANSEIITLRGSPSCGTWIADNQKQNEWPKMINQNWLIGFLSGLAVGSSNNSVIGTDNNSLNLWMDNYCKSNPLETVSDGGIDLFIELTNKKGLK